MFKFTFVKSPQVSSDEFESAVNCSRSSVESVLGDEFLVENLHGDSITIRTVDVEKPIAITLSQCKETIQGCFCDEVGALYAQFLEVIPE